MTENYEYSSQENYEVTSEEEKEFVGSSLSALILGIASLCNMALFGWIPAIIGLSQANKALNIIEQNPDHYTENSKNMASAGKKMSIIGLIFGIIGMFVTFFYYYWVITQTLRTGGHYHPY